MSIITAIGTASPQHKHSQADIKKFMLKNNASNQRDQRVINVLYDKSKIDSRHSVLEDFSKEGSTFFSEETPDIEHRMEVFESKATDLASEAILNAIDKEKLHSITHLITVTCTGLSAPGLDIALVKHLGLKPQIERTSINFMGCYAAIHALKQANYIVKAQENAKVLVVCIELCTLHFQKESTDHNLRANALFADGAAACIIENQGSGFKMESFFSKLVLEHEDKMSWKLSKTGFLMELSSEIPAVLKDNMQSFVKEAVKENKIDNWIIHPGGKRILEASIETLGLEKDALNTSYEVLSQHGNMSSCTVLFILKKQGLNRNENTFLAAFGPGITMESILLKTV